MKGNYKNFHQLALIIVLIITYSSFSDCSYTVFSTSDNHNLFLNINTQNVPSDNPYVFYYHLPSIPLEEDYAGTLQKVPYQLITYRQGTTAGLFYNFPAYAILLPVLLVVFSMKRFGADKPRLYYLFPLRGHGPPYDRLLLSPVYH